MISVTRFAGTPSDFDLSRTLRALLARGIPTFGVCLGLQGLVEHLGGELGVLDYPMHGKASRIHVRGGRLFAKRYYDVAKQREHGRKRFAQNGAQFLRVARRAEISVAQL